MSRPRLLVLFGSQEGTAEGIAELLVKQAQAKGYDAQLSSMDAAVSKIPNEKLIVIVTATTGDGEPPGKNALKFNRFLHRVPMPLLQHLSYAVLGLGDTNYTNFCNNGVVTDHKLAERGAVRFYPLGKADDAAGLENVVEPWTAGLWAPLEAAAAAIARGEQPAHIGTDRNLHPSAEKGDPAKASATVADAVAAVATPVTVAPVTTTPVVIDNSTVTPKDEIRTIGSDATAAASGASAPSSGSPATPAATAGAEPKKAKRVIVPKLPEPFLGLAMFVPSQFPGLEVLLGGVRLTPEIDYSVPRVGHAHSPALRGTVASARELVHVGDRRVMEITINLPEPIAYAPGDAFGVYCPNRLSDVEYIERRLNLDPFAVVHVTASADKVVPNYIVTPCTVREMLLHMVAFHSAMPKKGLLRYFYEYATNEEERVKIAFLSTDGYMDMVKDPPSLMELLAEFPSSNPPLARILEHTQRLLPRYYSVVSSAIEQPNSITVAYSIAEYERPIRGGLFKGLCSEYLAAARTVVPIFQRPGQNFTVPASLATPLIMIGTGTGISPFVSFIRERRLRAAREGKPAGPAWLFYGCRTEADCLYKDEFNAALGDGSLTQFVTAFSRNQTEKIYVQHRVKEHGAALADLLLNHGACVFVCGEIKDMPLAVQQAVAGALVAHGGKGEPDAAAIVQGWRREGRYVLDSWL